MQNPVILKLRRGAALSGGDEATILSGLTVQKTVKRRVDMIREGAASAGIVVVLEGFACRYKTLRRGVRQIVALLVPGDFCNMHAALYQEMDNTIGTLSSCKISTIRRHTMDTWIDEHPNIRGAVEWAALVDGSISREWLVNVGARSASQRLAHLLCELQARLRAVDIGEVDTFPMPLTQENLSELLGLSLVHINRTMVGLRADGLVTVRSGTVRVLDKDGLAALAEFKDNYLHLKPTATTAALTSETPH